VPKSADVDYEHLLRFRVALRRFDHWSRDQARRAGVTSAQHQLLLCVRGHPHAAGPTIGDIADYLLLRHHSVVELVNRAEHAGLVERRNDAVDGRVARLVLTRRGKGTLRRLAEAHLDEIRQLAQLLQPVLPPAPEEPAA
jgi:DNA-binding MarR family transcriptional regulator